MKGMIGCARRSVFQLAYQHAAGCRVRRAALPALSASVIAPWRIPHTSRSIRPTRTRKCLGGEIKAVGLSVPSAMSRWRSAGGRGNPAVDERQVLLAAVNAAIFAFHIHQHEAVAFHSLLQGSCGSPRSGSGRRLSVIDMLLSDAKVKRTASAP